MKKSELKALIKEVVQQVLTENSTYNWNDGTQIIIGPNGKIAGGKYKGQDLDVSGWEDYGWANGWTNAYYKSKVEPKTKGKESYRISYGTRGTKEMYVYPETKVSYMVDSSD
jgi:hypothetical protein